MRYTDQCSMCKFPFEINRSSVFCLHFRMSSILDEKLRSFFVKVVIQIHFTFSCNLLSVQAATRDCITALARDIDKHQEYIRDASRQLLCPSAVCSVVMSRRLLNHTVCPRHSEALRSLSTKREREARMDGEKEGSAESDLCS